MYKRKNVINLKYMLSLTSNFNNQYQLNTNYYLQTFKNRTLPYINESTTKQYNVQDDVLSNVTNYTFTDENAEIPYYIKVTSITFCILIMCMGVIGNILVPIVIFRTKDMRNSTNIFLVNLSIADLMVLLVCTPTVLVEVNSRPETWVLGKELCLAVPFVELTVAHTSVLTILAISFERYYAICEPLRAGYVCTKTRATLICALAWFIAAVFTSPILNIAEHKFKMDNHGQEIPMCLTEAINFWPALFFITTIILFYFIPLTVLIFLYTIITKNLIKTSRKVSKYVDPYNPRARRQVILMLITVVISFFICLMPFKIFTLWIIITPINVIEQVSADKFYNVLYFSRIMLYLNSAINPILYNLMSSKFRKGFYKICNIVSYNIEIEERDRVGIFTNSTNLSKGSDAKKIADFVKYKRRCSLPSDTYLNDVKFIRRNKSDSYLCKEYCVGLENMIDNNSKIDKL